jgi:hypothetical protein
MMVSRDWRKLDMFNIINFMCVFTVTRKIALINIPLSLCPAGEEFKQYSKIMVKVAVKFIRKRKQFLKVVCLKGKNYEPGFKVGIFFEKQLALGPFSPWDDFLGLGHCLVK